MTRLTRFVVTLSLTHRHECAQAKNLYHICRMANDISKLEIADATLHGAVARCEDFAAAGEYGSACYTVAAAKATNVANMGSIYV